MYTAKGTAGQRVKGVFPYEWLDSAEKLQQDHLPPIEEWYSDFTNSHLLGDTEDKQVARLVELQEIWELHGMQTMHDFLRWYQMLDVVPYAVAVCNWSRRYWSRLTIRSCESLDWYSSVSVLSTERGKSSTRPASQETHWTG
jgi:hypothetical protein